MIQSTPQVASATLSVASSPATVCRAVAVWLLLAGLWGCAEQSSEQLQSFWGPLDSGNGQLRFDDGRAFGVTGLVHEVELRGAVLESGEDRRLLEVVLVGGDLPVSCSVYSEFLRKVELQQTYIDDVFAAPADERPEQEDLVAYVCQDVGAAALEAFGNSGSYRALHALLDLADGPQDDLFRPSPLPAEGQFFGADVLAPGHFVSRIYERSLHGEAILPDGGEGPWTDEDVDPVSSCVTVLTKLLEEREAGRTEYPDRDSIGLQAANHRYYHHDPPDEVVTLQGATQPFLNVGLTLPGWDRVAALGGNLDVTLFGRLSRAPEIFPYSELLVSSLGTPIPVEACPSLRAHLPLVWPELPGVESIDALP